MIVSGGDSHHLIAEQTDTSCNVLVHPNDFQLLYFTDCLFSIYLICKSLCMYIHNSTISPSVYIACTRYRYECVRGICTGE